jgi:hypothetical protein
MRWLPKPSMSKPFKGPSVAVTDERFEHIQAFFDTTRGQITIGEIPPIRRAAHSPPSAKQRALPWSAEKRKAYPTCCCA